MRLSVADGLSVHDWQKHIIIFALRLTTLHLCRVTLGPSLQSEKVRNDIHSRAVEVALRIAEMRQAKVPRLFEMNWYSNLCETLSR